MVGMGTRARRGRARTLLTTSLAVTLLVAACSSDDDDSSTTAAEEPASTSSDTGPSSSDAPDSEPASTDAEEPASLTTVSAGVPVLANFAPVLWGIELGFFEDEGIDLQLNEDVAGPAVVPAVAAGQLDVGVTVWAGMIPAAAQDLPLTGIAGVFQALTADDPETNTVDTVALVVLSDSEITAPADIAGATIAVPNVASLAAIEVHKIAEEAGLERDDYTLVQVDFPNMATALRSGQVDAAYLTEPFITPLTAPGEARVVPGATQGSVSPGQPAGVMAANAQWAADNPDLVAALQRALRRAADHARENEDELRAALPDLLGIPSEVADSVVLPTFSAEFDVADLQEIADTMLEFEILQEPLDVSAFVIAMP